MITVTKQFVRVREFLAQQIYVGPIAGCVRPYWADTLELMFDQVDPPQPVVVDGAIGTGKTTFAQLAALRLLYELLEFGGAPAYGLGAGATVHLLVTDRFMVARLDDLLRKSHYFCGRWVATKNELQFDRNIIVTHAKADDQSILGLNVVGLVVDDANNRDINAERMFLIARSVRRRMESNPDKPGLILLAGAGARNTGMAVAELDAMHRRSSVWEVNPEAWSADRFNVAIYPPGLGPHKKTRILASGEAVEADPDLKIVQVPEDLRREFEKNVLGSLRDFAGEAV